MNRHLGLSKASSIHKLPGNKHKDGCAHHFSRRNGKWVLSVKYWREPTVRPEPDCRIAAGAVDTGISPMATDSDGQVWENPKAYYQAERKLRRWQKAQARRKLDSRGWWEVQRGIDRLQPRTTGPRRNARHQMTSTLVNKFQSLVIENLNIKGMLTGLTPKAQSDAGMGEIRRQFLYEGEWHHCEVVLADRFYPSSKTCSACGIVNAKLKRERHWRCGSCGTKHERNLNAAVNLRNLLTFPGGAGETLRDGKALAAGSTCRETRPDDRRTARQGLAPDNADCVMADRSKLNVNTP